MARPISEEKRKAILAAAEKLVAETGTGVSTARIAKAAGVAEGTVFVYFETKAALMAALLSELEQELAAAFSVGDMPGDGGRGDIRHAWERMIAFGAAHPAKWRAIKRLKVSEFLTAAGRKQMDALFGDVQTALAKALRNHAQAGVTVDYAALVLNALAEVTFECIAAEPQRDRHYTELGFDLFWNGMTAGKAD
ncbi:TetR/AcrR family transcriptional regulator [Martelella sp. FLE1502]